VEARKPEFLRRASVQSGRRGSRLVAYLSKFIMTFPVSRPAALTALALAIATPTTFADNLTILAPVIVTATRTPQASTDVLSDNITIDADEIARSGAGSLTELLQRQRGIEVARNGGPGTASSVFIRGANNDQSIVLIDGVRSNPSTLGGAAWSTIPLSAIDHVEIVYGPLSTMYGANAAGGVIQIFTKQGSGAPRVSVSAGAGSDATRAFDGSIAGATGGEHSLSYALNIGKEKSDGFSAIKPGSSFANSDQDGYDKESASGRLTLQLAKGHEAGLVFLQSRLDAQSDNGPGYDARSWTKIDNLGAFSKHQILPNWSSQFQLAEARNWSRVDVGTIAFDKFQISAKQTSFSWQNDFMVGADVLQILLEHDKEAVQSSTDSGLAQERTTRSVAASYNLKRDRHLAGASLRNDDNSLYGATRTGALSYGYRLTGALRANASAGTSFRAPTVYDLYVPYGGTPANKPEKGRNLEAGLYFNDGKSQLSAVYYHNRLTDLLVYSSPCPFNPIGCVYNVNRALLEGISLSARRQLGQFNVGGNIDLQNPHNEETGLLLARRAKRHANFTAEYGVGALQGGVEWQLSGKRFDDAANTDAMGGYGLLNLFATYQIAPDWSLLARWNNVANKEYELAKDFATAGSKVFVGLRYGMK
jgi:vitamin B12 transporter